MTGMLRPTSASLRHRRGLQERNPQQHDASLSYLSRLLAWFAVAAALCALSTATVGCDEQSPAEREVADQTAFARGAVSTSQDRPGAAEPHAAAGADRYWPQWRGPLATGAAPHANPPVEWSEEKNIRWKIELPGKGHSTPIVWDDRVFITAAIPYGDSLPPRFSDAPGAHDNASVTHHHEFAVLAISRSDGSIIWQTTVHKELPHEAGHVSASLASNSPVTDGEHVYAFFGSRGLYCLDFDGEVKWKVDLGRMQSKHAHGEGSSPVLYGDTIAVNWDHQGRSFVAAFDKRTGEERWRKDRDEPTSWATPIVVEHKGKAQLIVCGTNRIRAYDLDDGEVIWECGGLSKNIVASPVAGGGFVYAGSSYDSRAILAIRLEGARGDITATDHVVWSHVRGAPYVPSPLLYNDVLYSLNHYQSVLTRVHGPTGEGRPGSMRLPGVFNIYSSPVAAAGRVYITDRDGTTVVITDTDNAEVLSLNRLDATFSASAALVDGEIFLRGERYLYCIAEDEG